MPKIHLFLVLWYWLSILTVSFVLHTSSRYSQLLYLVSHTTIARPDNVRRLIDPALSLLMKHQVIGQRRKAPNFSAFHWSPHDILVSIGQHFVTTRVVHLPKRTETNLITESDQGASNHQLCTAWSDPNRTRLCWPCIAAIAGFTHFRERTLITCRTWVQSSWC